MSCPDFWRMKVMVSPIFSSTPSAFASS